MMAIVGNVEEIIEIKNKLARLQMDGVLSEWELPYEYLLTRKSAAIFFISLSSDNYLEDIQTFIKEYGGTCSKNEEKTLSNLKYRIDFQV